jgi:hypothetical protein
MVKKIPRPRPHESKQFSAQEPPNYDELPIVFSLERIQPGNYCFSSLKKEHQAMFADAIYRRKNMTWRQIKQAPKHGLGTEKLPISCITAPTPPCVTEDLDDFLALRYHGKCPMVGYRERNLFFVLWFDHDFTLYPH